MDSNRIHSIDGQATGSMRISRKNPFEQPLKQGFNFGEVARRGLEAVHGELLEKGLAYNLCHMARTRRAEESRLDEAPLAAAA